MRLLFITRKFPPMVGGMENLSFALAREFSKQTDTTLIAWNKSQKFLPLVIPVFLLKSIRLIVAKKINHIHIGDGLLAPLGLFLKTVFGIQTTITIAGLDVTFNFPGYQLIVPRCIARLDKIVCISNATLEECVKRGIPKEKCIVIPCGVYPNEFIVKTTKKDLGNIVGINLKDKKIIITVGRLVKRKGVHWFIKNVLSKLNKNIIYLIVGKGPEKERIEKAIRDLRLQEQVFLLGKISNEKLKIIYNTADLFVMPNIKVPETTEGFGIVAIEASSAGLQVIASDIEGISSAISDGKNGHLLPSEKPKEWQMAVSEMLSRKQTHKNSVKEWTRKNYDWKEIGKMYLTNFSK